MNLFTGIDTGGPSLFNLKNWEWNRFETVLMLIIINSFLCLIDFLQVHITGQKGSHSYGRHSDHKTFASYFPSIPNRLGWVYMECPSVVVFLFVYFQGKNCWEPVPFVLMIMWQVHYFQRSFIYPLFLMKSAPGRKQNSLLTTVGFVYNTLNSYVNASMISEYGNYPVEYFQDWRFVVGTLIFIVGYNINRRSDAILQRLRSNSNMKENASNNNNESTKSNGNSDSSASSSSSTTASAANLRNRKNRVEQLQDEGYTTHAGSEGDDEFESDASTTLSSIYSKSETSEQSIGKTVSEEILARNETYIDKAGVVYKIPFGGLYNYVSSANYFGEIVEWCGWTLATYSLAGLSFALFTSGNLVPRAYWNHDWYKDNFKHYPKERKAIIPFVF